MWHKELKLNFLLFYKKRLTPFIVLKYVIKFNNYHRLRVFFMSYIFKENFAITLPKGAENPVVAEILANYTFGRQWDINYGDGLFIKIGNGTPCNPSGYEYTINIENGGVFISSDSFSGVMRGLLAFLERLKYDDKSDIFYAECGLLKERGSISFRCVHLCVYVHYVFWWHRFAEKKKQV